MPRRPDTPCADCGRLLWSGRNSLPAGVRRCHPCRRANPRERVLCVTCGQPTSGYPSKSAPAKPRTCRACRSASRNRECEICATPYRPSYSGQRTCGRACGVELRRREGSLPAEPSAPSCRVYFIDCVICGTCVTARKARRKLCADPACRREYARLSMNAGYPRFRDRLLAAAAIRQARIIEQPERLDPLEIFERDRWRCGICGKPVRRKARRKHDPLMASLDHIVPLSRGGEHTPENTRCTHYRCNLSRNARGGNEQLAIIG